MNDSIQIVAEYLQNAKSVVAFTGAGISTESGIPDYRSPGGVWATSQPVMYDDFVRSEESRQEYWRQKSGTHRDFFDCPPNAGHNILAKWQKEGRLRGVITQNIDGLHEVAGSTDVIEIHGTARFVDCIKCGHRHDAEPMVAYFLKENHPPICESCGGVTKHATISFGQALVPEVIEKAVEWAVESDLMFAIGSSLVVEPAASIPRVAKSKGARLVIVNRDPTPLDGMADLVIGASIGETLTAIDQATP